MVLNCMSEAFDSHRQTAYEIANFDSLLAVALMNEDNFTNRLESLPKVDSCQHHKMLA